MKVTDDQFPHPLRPFFTHFTKLLTAQALMVLTPSLKPFPRLAPTKTAACSCASQVYLLHG